MSSYEEHKEKAKIAFKWAVIPIIVWTLYQQNWSVSGLALHSWEVLICFALCLLGAMLPDTDIDSKARKIVYTVLFTLAAPFVVLNYCRLVAVVGLVAMLPGILPHRHKRGPHSTLVVMILLSPFLAMPIIATGKMGIQQLGVSYYVAAVIGHTSHILADRKKKGTARNPIRKLIDFISRHISPWAAIIYFVVIIPVMVWTIHKKGLSIGILREFLICSVVYMLVVKLISAIVQLISRIKKVPGTIITMHIIVIVVVVAWTIYRQGLYVTDTLRGIFICSAAYAIGLRLPRVDLKQSWQKEIYSVLIPTKN